MAQHRRDLKISALTDEKFSAAVEGYRASKGQK